MGLLELFGVGVEGEAAFIGGPEDGVPGLLADIGLVIQDTGDGAHRVAGLGRKIFNCQDGHFLSILVILKRFQCKLHVIIPPFSKYGKQKYDIL